MLNLNKARYQIKEVFIINITNSFRCLVFLGLIAFLMACGGGGDSDANSPLAGTWYGTLEDSSSVMHALSVTISSNNTISSIIIDNVNQNLTGAITAQASTIQFTFQRILQETGRVIR